APVREGPPLRAVVVEVRVVALVDEHLDRDANLATVAEHAGVGIRDPPGSAIRVQPFVVRAHLPLAIQFDVLGTASSRPIQTSDTGARLENLIVVSELTELVAEHEPRHAGTQDEYFRVGRPAGAGERRTAAGLARHQVPRLESGHDKRGSANDSELLE